MKVCHGCGDYGVEPIDPYYALDSKLFEALICLLHVLFEFYNADMLLL